MNLNSIKGTRDFYPEDLRIQRWLFDKFRETSSIFGFQEYDAPIVENSGLYTRKSGEEIVEQMFVLEKKTVESIGENHENTDEEYNGDNSNANKMVLRPEMTPSLARLILQRAKSIIMPIRWFSITQCWRYERCTTGRKREFYQWNLDILGDPGYGAEFELITALIDFFNRVNLNSNEIVIKISDRKLLNLLLQRIGLDRETINLTEVLRILDKRDKVDNPEELLMKIGLTRSEAIQVLNFSKMNLKDCLEFLEIEESTNDLNNLFSLAKELKIEAWLEFDLTVVRGLDYYTDIVFEVFDRKKRFRAICGGGRYDKLIESYDSTVNIPACGFGFGDCVIFEVLKSLKKLPDDLQLREKNKTEFLIVPFNVEFEKVAVKIAANLRQEGRKAQYIFASKKRLKWYYSYADREKIKWVILVAPDEYKLGKVQVKNLESSTSNSVLINEIKYVQ